MTIEPSPPCGRVPDDQLGSCITSRHHSTACHASTQALESRNSLKWFQNSPAKGRPEPLRRVGLLAATHHERMDGSGYHRGVAGTMISAPARILAAADAYHAMTQARPHRAALNAARAAQELRTEVDRGRLDPAAADAVLTAAGQRPSRTRAGGPAGLTTREAEVLGLLARGLPNKGIARQLGISPKTVSNHIEHVYTKLAVSSRAGAALHAMRLGLVAEWR